MSAKGQKQKSSDRANVFRFALQSGPPISALRHRSPHHPVAFADELSGLQAILDPAEVLARALGLPIEDTSRVELVAPIVDFHGAQAGRQFESRERGFAMIGRAIGERIGIDWSSSRFDVEQFRMGLRVELEHGRQDPSTNVTDDDEITTGKIARAHLNEFPDYYTRLAEMEAEAERYWADRERS